MIRVALLKHERATLIQYSQCYERTTADTIYMLRGHPLNHCNPCGTNDIMMTIMTTIMNDDNNDDI